MLTLPRMVLLAGSLVLLSCTQCKGAGSTPTEPDDVAAALKRLRDFEQSSRDSTDFATLPSANEVMGVDPYAIAELPGTTGFIGLHRGASEVALIAADGRAVHRASAPSSPTALAVTPDGEIFVAGEHASEIARYRVHEGRIVASGTILLAAPEGQPRINAIRAMDYAPSDDGGVLYLVEDQYDRLITVRVAGDTTPVTQRVCAGAFQVKRSRSKLLVNCLIDHELWLLPVDDDGAVPVPASGKPPHIRHDGPVWSFATFWQDDALRIALGGVEDHPLDRSAGFFGHIDSFVYLYADADEPEQLAALNVSALGLVLPKALVWRASGLLVSGYASEVALDFPMTATGFGEPTATVVPPGIRAIAPRAKGGFVAANPLLDAWLVFGDGPARVRRLAGLEPAKHVGEIRVGEAMFFTTMMAPDTISDGAHSRFTCETCHLDGYVDGRTHHTSRGDIHATTKPLLGLFNNRPHFTRALDPDLTRVAHAEFRVAGQGTGKSAWFTLDPAEHPWLGELSGRTSKLEPEMLRRSLMRFLMAFTHRPNPNAVARDGFTEVEQRGAQLFNERCSRCHAARLSTDVKGSLPFQQWEALVFDPRGPLVWASDGYRKTGVQPYVHEHGARTTSLRRVYKKRPYFTNGSAKTLSEVVAGVRFDDKGRMWHADAPPAAQALAADQQAALEAFLRLL